MKKLVTIGAVATVGAITGLVICVKAKKRNEVIKEYYEYFDDEEKEEGIDVEKMFEKEGNTLESFGEFPPLMSDRYKKEYPEIVIPKVSEKEVQEVQEVQEKKVEAQIQKEMLDMSKEIGEITEELRHIFPIEGTYGSACSLWQVALRDGCVTEQRFDEAGQYYGSMWHYTGD